MRWLTFLVCAGMVLVLQTTLAGWASIMGVRPDWVLALAVFFGLYARRGDAFVAGWVLGLGADLLSVERLGLLAIAYCVAALLANSIRDLVFLKNAVTHFWVTLLVGVIVHTGLSVYRVAVYSGGAGGLGRALVEGVLVSLYTAGWAVLIHHVLLKGSRAFGLHTSRYGYRGGLRFGVAGV